MDHVAFDLTPIEKQSAVWLKLKSHYEKRLNDFRKNNDGNHGTDETNRLRGRITECKYFLSLDQELPLIEK